MKKLTSKIAGVALAATMALVSAGTPSVSQNIGLCLDPRAANAARQSGQILPLVDVLRRQNVGRAAKILNVRVCQINGSLHYIIDVLRRNGLAQHFVLRGSDGSPYIGG